MRFLLVNCALQNNDGLKRGFKINWLESFTIILECVVA